MNIRIFMGATLMLLTAAISHAETVLIGNPGLHFSSLPLSQVSRIFLGQTSQLPDGGAAIPLDVSGGSREQFYRDVLKKSPEQIEKYWARMIFTGKAQPPREVRPGDVKSVVAETPGAISYIDSSKVDGSVKVIHIDASH
ncbi:MAG: phosphate ABC transporter substrate-binding protein [bacterium]|nr:phosphate ABC transporter substrate-binding protein [bacterium]